MDCTMTWWRWWTPLQIRSNIFLSILRLREISKVDHYTRDYTIAHDTRPIHKRLYDHIRLEVEIISN
jgi:hypothetical protein